MNIFGYRRPQQDLPILRELAVLAAIQIEAGDFVAEESRQRCMVRLSLENFLMAS